ncbi:hypothetical protein GALMADRAFT_229477 [Galerina marginata CBS 339.88]|uniref:Uncharacterized protein n=1 Tax=Galerina marginata (strain CBS 339.88) TaxID=685588 RepID=A0A067SXN8_GALM3|nr:hypothetical protein GALMADRAFT_229477 [Galerina marginata CBS 339.88]
MALPYVPSSTIFKDLNSLNLVVYNIATAIWGANLCNSVATSISQGLTTAQIKTDYVLWGFISPDSAIKYRISCGVLSVAHLSNFSGNTLTVRIC